MCRQSRNMGISKPDPQQVYLLCRAIFSGGDARIRNTVAIKKRIDDNRKSLRPLIKEGGQEPLIATLKDLLRKQIFEAEVKAKIAFPDLFQDQLNRDAERDESEMNAALSYKQELKDAVSAEGRGEHVKPTRPTRSTRSPRPKIPREVLREKAKEKVELNTGKHL